MDSTSKTDDLHPVRIIYRIKVNFLILIDL